MANTTFSGPVRSEAGFQVATKNNTTASPELIFAWGNGGQYLFISPKHQLIFVFTGTNFNSREMLKPQRKVKEWLDALSTK